MQTFLLDTHTIIWLANDPKLLSGAAEAALNSENKLIVSHVSVWEVAIKIKIGKLNLQLPLKEFIVKATEKHLLDFLNISLEHIYFTQTLPPHHQDPFDRLLIAQSLVENIAIISADKIFDSYNVPRIW